MQRTNAIGRNRARGFTLVELMIVVVIIGILASIATVGFRRYIGRARTAEAVAMLAEMSSKEQVYYLEFGGYLPLRGDNDATIPSPNENATAFYPANPDASTFKSSRIATSIATQTAWPTSWRSIGLRPRASQLYCTYLTNAGAAGQTPAGAIGKQVVSSAGATGPAWYYSIAACNLNGQAGFPANVSYFVISSDSPTLRSYNDGM